MGSITVKNILPVLLVIVSFFFTSINISSTLLASTPRTKITQRINKSPLLTPSIKENAKILYKCRPSNCDYLSKEKILPESPPQHVIDGLVLNNTLSREGYDFYIMFTHYWTPPAKAVNFQIIVKEYSRAGRNTALAISLNDKELVYRVITPSYSAMNSLASAAANHLSTYLKNGNHLKGLETKSSLKDDKTKKRITSPFDVN